MLTEIKKSSILIVDDHYIIRDGIKALIGRFPGNEIVAEASNGNDAVEKYIHFKPDLIILDISLPDMNGLEVARKILALESEARIIMYSMFNEEEYITACIEIGVQGYVIKTENSVELENAVQTVLDGGSYFSRTVQEVIVNRYKRIAKNKRSNEEEVKLTARESEIVKLIDQGLTTHLIAEKLFLSPRTVETHRSNIAKKLGVKNAIELLRKARELNYI